MTEAFGLPIVIDTTTLPNEIGIRGVHARVSITNLQHPAVWHARAIDLPWIIETAIRKYPSFDANAALLWGAAHLKNDDVAILRTEDTWCVAVCGERFYAPGKRQAEVLLICSARDDRRSAPQLLALVRAIYAWAIERGCWRLDFAAETTRCDLGPLVRRLGTPRQHASYMLELPAKGG
jgi:hypothetical protein